MNEKQLLILIDLHKDLTTGNKFYESEKLENIVNTLQFCKENNISTLNALYQPYTETHPSVSQHEFNFNLQDKVDLFEYDRIYFTGISLDQCVYNTRALSYLNVPHNDKKIILNCSILGKKIYLRNAPFPVMEQEPSALKEIKKYEKEFLIFSGAEWVEKIN